MGRLRRGEPVVPQPRHKLGVRLQLPNAGIVVGRGDSGHEIAVSGLLDQVRHRAARPVAIDEVRHPLARKVGVHRKHPAHPVSVEYVEVARAGRTLGGGQSRDVGPAKVLLDRSKAGADAGGFGIPRSIRAHHGGQEEDSGEREGLHGGLLSTS